MNADEIIKLVKKYNLKFVHRREISFFTHSFFLNVYVKSRLKNLLGFGYPAILVFHNKLSNYTFFNQDFIVVKFSEILMNNPDNPLKILRKANHMLDDYLEKISIAEKNIKKNPKHLLKVLSEHYHKVMLCLGVSNCVYRYVGDCEKNKGLNQKVIELASKGRQRSSEAYYHADKILKKALDLLDKEVDFDASLMMFMTEDELKDYLIKNYVSKQKLGELAKRKEGYLLLVYNNKEIIITNKKVIQIIRNTLLKEKIEKIDFIEGKTVFPGFVKGYVYNLIEDSKNVYGKDFIIVTDMTKPDHILLIKKCSAIVTDEGGMLCHAAIVAREMGKPCIVGTKNATKVFKNNDLVEVDADKGIVRLLEKSVK